MLLKTHQHGGVLTIGSSMAGDREAPQQMIKATHHIICTIAMISVRGHGCAEPRGHPTPTPAIFCCCPTRGIEAFVVLSPQSLTSFWTLHLVFINRNVLFVFRLGDFFFSKVEWHMYCNDHFCLLQFTAILKSTTNLSTTNAPLTLSFHMYQELFSKQPIHTQRRNCCTVHCSVSTLAWTHPQTNGVHFITVTIF